MLRQLAHEIRNPLATILSAVQLLELKGSHSPEGRDCVHHIREAVLRIDRLLKDLRALVMLAAPNPQEVSVGDQLRAAANRWGRSAEEKGIKIVVTGNLKVVVRADPEQLKQALDELVENALAVTPEGSDVVLLGEESGDKVAIHVDDSGPGIDPAVIEKLAEPFFSTRASGSGLGLTKARAIARLGGGELVWRNLAGKGARFSLLFPKTER